MSAKLTIEHFKAVATSRNHSVELVGEYKSVQKSKLSLVCHTCGNSWETRVASYLNSKNGCWTCKKRKISLVQQGKIFSPELKRHLSTKAQERTSHWYQLNPKDWHREDTLYLVLLNHNGRDVVKVGRSFQGAKYHKGRLKHIFGEWVAPSFWVWWVEKIVKESFRDYRYTGRKPGGLKDLPGYSECFTDDFEVDRVITLIERLMTRQSAAKPFTLEGKVQRLPGEPSVARNTGSASDNPNKGLVI